MVLLSLWVSFQKGKLVNYVCKILALIPPWTILYNYSIWSFHLLSYQQLLHTYVNLSLYYKKKGVLLV